jgi:acid stress-induced BolA-like protein IbaG/YrbA
MDSEAVAALIREGIPGAVVEVSSDDNVHFQAVVVSEAFAGLRAPARHRLVYRSLGDRVGNEIHALSIRALTPDERQAG